MVLCVMEKTLLLLTLMAGCAPYSPDRIQKAMADSLIYLCFDDSATVLDRTAFWLRATLISRLMKRFTFSLPRDTLSSDARN